MVPNGQSVYNSQLVSYLSTLHPFHGTEFGSKDAFTLYHVIQEEDKTTGLMGGPALPALGHAMAGSVATSTAKLLLYPLDLVITRMQVQRQLHGPKEAPSAASEAGAEYNSLLDAARKIYETEGGLKAFYTGCGPDVAKSLADSFMFFLGYSFLRQRQLSRDGTKNLSVPKELAIGMAAGAFARFWTTPIQNIVTRQQTAAMIAARNPGASTTTEQADKLSVKDIALQIRSERGITGFWAGYSASLILTVNPAITFATHSLLQRLLPKSKREQPGPHLTFLLAALSKAIATAVTYPVSLAKSRAQVSKPSSSADSETPERDEKLPKYLDKPDMDSTPRRRKVKTNLAKLLGLLRAQYAILTSLRRIYRKEGLEGLYSGLEAEMLKGFLSHGFTMMMKDTVHVGVIQAYYMLLKLTKRWPEDIGNATSEIKERAENVGVTVMEGTKSATSDVREWASNGSGTVLQGARNASADVRERAGNIGETVLEGAKNVIDHGKKLVKGS